MAPARKWTDAEDSLLMELWLQNDLSLAEISRRLDNISPDTIKSRAERLGLEKRVFQVWPRNRKTLLVKLWSSGHNAADICKKMPEYSRKAITSKLDRLGLLNGANRDPKIPSPHSASITLVKSVQTGETYQVPSGKN